METGERQAWAITNIFTDRSSCGVLNWWGGLCLHNWMAARVVLTWLSESFYLCLFIIAHDLIYFSPPPPPFLSMPVQFVVIPTRRATAVAFQSFTSHLLGDAGSPYLIGLVRLTKKQFCVLTKVWGEAVCLSFTPGRNTQLERTALVNQ